MLDGISGLIKAVLDPADSSFDLTAWQMAARSVAVYLFAIAIVRLGNKRFMGRNTAFDLLLGIMLGSVLSRGITGQAPLLGCMAAGGVLLLMHWLIAALAYHIKGFGPIVKGRPRVLVRDGRVDDEAMGRSHMGNEDLAEALRAHGKTEDPGSVRLACLERSGDISVIPLKKEPRVVEIRVADGVQTVRLEISG